MTFDRVAEEIRTLSRELGRRPNLREWQNRFKHSQHTLDKFGRWSAVLNAVFSAGNDDFEAPQLTDTDEEIPLDELIRRRKQDYARKSEADDTRRLIRVKVKMDGPIGIAHFGDPHVDDDGTDISELEHNKALVQSTEGMMAANVGDITNNWIARLARLYGEQSTSARDAWRLCEWFIGGIDWLYLVGGNHDAWSGAGDPIKWIIRASSSIYQKTSVRLGLEFPNGAEVRINARHDFQGNSMWNPAHGPMRAAQMGWRDHILTCGHRHVSGYGLIKCPASGVVSHAIRVASYKHIDSFAREKGFPDGNISPCVVTIIDPYAETQRELVQVFQSVRLAAQVLTIMRGEWKRKRKRAA